MTAVYGATFALLSTAYMANAQRILGESCRNYAVKSWGTEENFLYYCCSADELHRPNEGCFARSANGQEDPESGTRSSR